MLVFASCGSKVTCDSSSVKKLAIELHENVIKSYILTKQMYPSLVIEYAPHLVVNYDTFKVLGWRSGNYSTGTGKIVTTVDKEFAKQKISLSSIIQKDKDGTCTCKANLIISSASIPINYRFLAVSSG